LGCSGLAHVLFPGTLQGAPYMCHGLWGCLKQSNCCDSNPGHYQVEPCLHPCRAGQGQTAPKRAMQVKCPLCLCHQYPCKKKVCLGNAVLAHDEVPNSVQHISTENVAVIAKRCCMIETSSLPPFCIKSCSAHAAVHVGQAQQQACKWCP